MPIYNLQYLIYFIIAAALAFLIARRIIPYAKKKGIVDKPGEIRKIHRTNMPLLGGVAVFLSFTATVILIIIMNKNFIQGYMLPKYIAGMTIAGLILMVGGYLDDKYNLSPLKQIIWPIMASIVIILSGIGIDLLRNPLGNSFRLDVINIKLFEYNNIPYYFTPLADIFTFLWLMGMMYTTKFLDGLDGLVSGILMIGAIILFFLSLTPSVMQPETAFLCIVLAGAFLGFLILNFNPAKIFLGEGGSSYAGLMLGIMAIISGGKIATALLILGIPVLDVAWVILRRLRYKKSPFHSADKKHLHHRLLEIGFTHRQAVIFLYLVSAIFGTIALYTEGKSKLISLLTLVVFMAILAIYLIFKEKRFLQGR